MDNWLTRSLDDAGMDPYDAAQILGMDRESYTILEQHPGMLTINEVNALCRALPDDVARRMLDRMRETFAI